MNKEPNKEPSEEQNKAPNEGEARVLSDEELKGIVGGIVEGSKKKNPSQFIADAILGW